MIWAFLFLFQSRVLDRLGQDLNSIRLGHAKIGVLKFDWIEILMYDNAQAICDFERFGWYRWGPQ